MTDLNWLENWRARYCDGDWEDCHGIRIETLDNPGWALFVDVDDTELEGKFFSEIVIDRTETDWVRCSVENSQFKGYGGPKNLTELISIFRSWAESQEEGKGA